MKTITRKSLQSHFKKILKIISYLFLAIIFILMIDFLITVKFRESSKYPYFVFGGDEYTYFGDGRFQILNGEKSKGLTDSNRYYEGEMISETLMADIEKYIEHKNYLYLIGYYTPEGLLKGKIPSLMPNSEEYVWFASIADVPRYTILNYETGDVQLYKTLEELPEKDRKIFEKDLNFWCKFKRTCFEK